MSATALRVGLLLRADSDATPCFDLACWAAARPDIEVSSIALRPPSTPRDARAGRGRPLRRNAIENALVHADETVHRLSLKAAGHTVHPVARPAILAEVSEYAPIVLDCEVQVSPDDYVSLLNARDLEQLRSMNFDVFVQFCRGTLRADFLRASRLGVLSAVYANITLGEDETFGFWEVYRGEPSTGFTLKYLTSTAAASGVLLRRNFVTAPTVERNKAKLIDRSCRALRDVLQHVAGTGTLPPAEPQVPDFGPGRAIPKVWTSLGLVGRQTGRVARHTLAQARSRGEWSVGVSRCDWRDLTARDAIPIEAPGSNWVADPFVVEFSGRSGVFVEEFEQSEGKGRISFQELGETRPVGPLQPVLEEAFHLSFPSTFQWQGHLFMVPETKASGEVRIYRCARFPDQWSLERIVLKDIIAVDPLILKKGESWFLLVNSDSLNGQDPASELNVFHTDDPLSGAWAPHPANPVVNDPRRARNGGILQSDGEIYRVAQMTNFGYGGYGSGVSIERLVELTETDFSEATLGQFTAGWGKGLAGPHTLSSQGGWTAFDYRRRIRGKADKRRRS